MAPEVLNKKNQSTKIDIWALGILLYELVHGFAPFPGKSMASVENKIFQGRIKFDPNLSKESQALVKKILRINPENRPDITEILEDPWVKMFGDHKSPTKNVGPLNSEIMGFNGRGEPTWGYENYKPGQNPPRQYSKSPLISGNGAGKLEHKVLTKNGSFYGISKTPNTACVGDSNWLEAKPVGTQGFESNTAGMNLKSNIVLASARLMGAKPKGVAKLS